MVSDAKVDTRYRLSESLAWSLAEAYGTPLYVIDEGHFRQTIRRYQAAFRAVWPKSELSYASKANSTLAVLAIAHNEGCVIDVASEGELRAALAAGVPASHCHLHGNNKSKAELEFALEAGIATIVIDNFDEISNLESRIADLKSSSTCFVLRLAPGVDPITHHKISTGQADTKFGFNIADGAAERAVQRCVESKLPLIGFHCHVGSQLLDPEAQQVGGELIAKFAVDMKKAHGLETTYLNVGGGLGVKYLDEHEPMPVEDYCRLIADSVRSAFSGTGLDPILGQEPGRALIAESGVTLYRVGAMKEVPSPTKGTRIYHSVDGGLADNPRPALYGSKYAVERVWSKNGFKEEEFETVTVSGRHCETDTLFEDVSLPTDLNSGDLLQVLCTGAYNSAMASNYNRYRRPPTAMIRANGSHELVQRSETWDEMFERELLPKDLKA